jgi:hypothetical protein
MRQGVMLRTKCGCERVLVIDHPRPRLLIPLRERIDPFASELPDLMKPTVRAFVWEGEYDHKTNLPSYREE